MLSVYVRNRHGRPLMPCSPAKARHLLKDGKAWVAERTPFTIQLRFGSSGYKQNITLGIDAGSKHIGVSAVTIAGRELFAAEVAIRNDVVENLSTRRAFRKARRNRKTRYRPPRFKNRHSKREGWLAPSVVVKIQEHITIIKRVCELLPITEVVVETAEFDLQRMDAIASGKPIPYGEDYNKGQQLDFYNVRQFVLWRDNYTCQCCGKHGKGIVLQVHHKESRQTGGNAPDNLITLCVDCHDKYHAGKIKLSKLKKRGKPSTRDATSMNIMRKTLMTRLHKELPVLVEETKGYITKYIRTELLHLPKSHINDAFAIAMGLTEDKEGKIKFRASRQYFIRPVRHHNRQIHKATILKGGIRQKNQAPKYVKGFRLFDKVLFEGKECFIWGRRSKGGMLLRQLDGTKIKDGVNFKKLKLLERSSNYLIS